VVAVRCLGLHRGTQGNPLNRATELGPRLGEKNPPSRQTEAKGEKEREGNPPGTTRVILEHCADWRGGRARNESSVRPNKKLKWGPCRNLKGLFESLLGALP